MCKKIKTTITLAQHIKSFASKEAKDLGLDFSAYITVLIAEKMRAVSLVSSTTQIATTTNSDSEVAIDACTENTTIAPIDTQQENEIDRLLQL